MTISRVKRLADQETTLRSLAMELGDELVCRKWWDIDRPDLAALVPTTWAELIERGLIVRHQRLNPPPSYELTEAGWVERLRLAGILDSGEFRARCIELVKYFKLTVAGRRDSHDAFLLRDPIRERFPFNWKGRRTRARSLRVINVLRSGLLQKMFPDKRMNARFDEVSKNVCVPVTFGMPE